MARALSARKQYSEAEPPFRSGYEGMSRREPRGRAPDQGAGMEREMELVNPRQRA